MTKARDLANVISGSGTLNANVIPALPASKITSGTFADARLSSSSVTQHVDLSNLSASNLTSGTVPSARLSLSASDVPDLATSKITSGTFADARISSGSVTQHVSATTSTLGSWTPTIVGSVNNNFSYAMGRYYKIGKLVHVVARFHTPHGADGNSNDSGGLGDNSSNVIKIGGLPFTSSNTSQVVFVGEDAVKISTRNVKAVVHSNSTEIRMFGLDTNLDGSYGSAGSQGSPQRGNELSAGNAHINWNDGGQKAGHVCFTYYTDTA